jgi:hypothetical protein
MGKRQFLILENFRAHLETIRCWLPLNQWRYGMMIPSDEHIFSLKLPNWW